MPIAFDYIAAFLQRQENPAPNHAPMLRGYVPMQKGQVIQNSGVTIASGLDLGQQTKEGLLKMGISPSVCSVLFPYVGLKREAAVAKLKNLPLLISRDTADDIDRAVFRSYILRAESIFNRIANDAGKPTFENVPKQIQAAFVSLYYQMGTTPHKTFGYLAKGDYRSALAELRDPARWGGKHTARRNDEARIVAEVA